MHWKEWCWSWNSSTSATSCEELTHWKRLWCWEGLGAGGEGDDRGWDGWMASLTRWTWVWVNSRSWWWTGRPGVLRFMGLQRVGHDWATELKWVHLEHSADVSFYYQYDVKRCSWYTVMWIEEAMKWYILWCHFLKNMYTCRGNIWKHIYHNVKSINCFNCMWTENSQIFNLCLEKAEEPEIKLPTSTGSVKKQENFKKISTSTSLTMLKCLTVWITINYGKFLRDENTRPADLPPEKSVCSSRSNS